LNILFFSIFLINFIYFFFKKRKIDLFTIFFLSSAFYAMPLFFGILYDPHDYHKYNIDNLVYMFYSGYFAILFLFIVFYDYFMLKKISQNTKYIVNRNNTIKKYYYILLSIVSSLLIIFFLKDPYFLFATTGKADFGQFGVLSALYIWGSLILFSLGLFIKNKKYLYSPSLFLFFTFFGGGRAYALTTGIMYFIYIFLYEKSKLRLISQYKYILIGISLLIFLISYKLVYNYIRLFDFDAIITILTSSDQYLFRIFQGGENFQTMVSFQHAIVDLEPYNENYLKLFFLKFIPFFSHGIANAFSLNLETFNYILRDNFYYNVSYGVSSSFWGEMIYTFGVIGCYTVLLLFLFLVGIFNYKLQENIKLIDIFMYPGVVYVIFYMHRNDFNFMIYAIYITIAFYFLIMFIRQILLKNKKKNEKNTDICR
jgi:hypothetical protein